MENATALVHDLHLVPLALHKAAHIIAADNAVNDDSQGIVPALFQRLLCVDHRLGAVQFAAVYLSSHTHLPIF